MSGRSRVTRRGFVKAVGGMAGAAALPSQAFAQDRAIQQAAAVQPPLSLRSVGGYPGLTKRGAPRPGAP